MADVAGAAGADVGAGEDAVPLESIEEVGVAVVAVAVGDLDTVF